MHTFIYLEHFPIVTVPHYISRYMTISKYLVPFSREEHDFVSDKRKNHHVAERSRLGSSSTQ